MSIEGHDFDQSELDYLNEQRAKMTPDERAFYDMEPGMLQKPYFWIYLLFVAIVAALAYFFL